jgi:hypothetical protein
VYRNTTEGVAELYFADVNLQAKKFGNFITFNYTTKINSTNFLTHRNAMCGKRINFQANLKK